LNLKYGLESLKSWKES